MKIYIPLTVLLISLQAFAQVWEVTTEWTDEHEVEFEDYVRTQISENLFTNPSSPYFGAGADCADFVIYARAGFAKSKGLNFVYRTNNGFIDQSESSRFQGNFVGFIQYLKDRVSTLNLGLNTFPVAVTKEALTPGVVFSFSVPLDGEEAYGRHVYLVKNVEKSGLLHFIWATVPPTPRMLSQRIQPPYYMPRTVAADNRFGFRRFFQPQDYYLGPDARKAAQAKRGRNDDDQRYLAQKVESRLEQNGLSLDLEQTDRTVTKDPNAVRQFQIEVIRRLHTTNPETTKERAARDLRNLCYYMQDRITFTTEGYDYFFDGRVSFNPRPNDYGDLVLDNCPTSTERYYFDTVSRDQEIFDFINGVTTWWDKNRDNPEIKDTTSHILYSHLFESPESYQDHYPEISEELVRIRLDAGERAWVNTYCPIEYKPGQYLEIRNVVENFVNRRTSPFPWVSLERRWGVEDPPTDYSETSLDCYERGDANAYPVKF